MGLQGANRKTLQKIQAMSFVELNSRYRCSASERPQVIAGSIASQKGLTPGLFISQVISIEMKGTYEGEATCC